MRIIKYRIKIKNNYYRDDNLFGQYVILEFNTKLEARKFIDKVDRHRPDTFWKDFSRIVEVEREIIFYKNPIQYLDFFLFKHHLKILLVIALGIIGVLNLITFKI